MVSIFNGVSNHISVKTLEQSQNEESSDSSEDEGDDDEEEEPVKSEPVKPVNNNVFTYPPPSNLSNGHPRPRNATLRKTKQKGYWQNFLSGLLEKYASPPPSKIDINRVKDIVTSFNTSLLCKLI